MNKLTVIYPYITNKILFNTKLYKLSNYEKKWRNFKCILVNERKWSENSMQHIIPVM